MRATVYSSHNFDKPYLQQASRGKHELIFIEESLNKKTSQLAKDSEAVILFLQDDADAEVVELLKKFGVKYIVLRSAGYNNIDLMRCHELGIKVANAPKYSPYSIAEYAMTLVLCLNRKIKLAQSLLSKDDFSLDNLTGFEMKEKVVGIIGVGRIGSSFAKIAHGFGCKILGFDIKENAMLKKDLNLNYVSLDELCKSSDIIRHC